MSKVDYRNKVLTKLSVHIRIYNCNQKKKNVFPKLCIPILPVSLDISMFMCLFLQEPDATHESCWLQHSQETLYMNIV